MIRQRLLRVAVPLVLFAASGCASSSDSSRTKSAQTEEPGSTVRSLQDSPVLLYDVPAGPVWIPSDVKPAESGPSQPITPTSDAESAPVPQQPAPTTPSKGTPAVKREKTVSAQKNNQQTAKRLSLSQLTKKYPALFKLHGSSEHKKIALTFDDAPDDNYTPKVLDILKKTNTKATFFLVGSRAEKHPQLVKRMVKEGHAIGNHSYNHPLFTKLSDSGFKSQVNKTNTILTRLIGYEPKYLRPPYGEISESQLLWASSHKLLVVNWNVDSEDWKQLTAKQVVHNVMKDVKPGSIILQHSGGGEGQDLSGTVEALPIIIQSIRSKGYQTVTIPELLR